MTTTTSPGGLHEPPPTRTRVVLTLEAVTDPNTRAGGPDRDPMLRLRGLLKVALRGYGWKCVSVADAERPEATASRTAAAGSEPGGEHR